MKKRFNLVGVTPETWARTIVLLLALINQILAIFGKGQIEVAESDIYQICSLIATVCSSVWAWWKNNSFTESGQAGDVTMRAIENNGYTFPESDAEHHREVG